MGHHSVQQTLIPQCFSGKKFVSEANLRSSFVFQYLEITLSTFTEEKEAYITDEIFSGLNIAKKNLANNIELENVKSNMKLSIKL